MSPGTQKVLLICAGVIALVAGAYLRDPELAGAGGLLLGAGGYQVGGRK